MVTAQSAAKGSQLLGVEIAIYSIRLSFLQKIKKLYTAKIPSNYWRSLNRIKGICLSQEGKVSIRISNDGAVIRVFLQDFFRLLAYKQGR